MAKKAETSEQKKPAKSAKNMPTESAVFVRTPPWYYSNGTGLMALAILGLIIPLISPFVYGYALQAEHDATMDGNELGPANRFFLTTAKKCGAAGMGVLAAYLLFGALTLLSYISDIKPF